MIDIAEKRKQRAIADRKTHLINGLYRLGLDMTRDGRKFEECSLFALEHIYIAEMCKAGKAFGEG